MNCQQTQDLLLTDFLDQQTNPEQQLQVHQHLKDCSVCREQWASITAVDATLKNVPSPDGPSPYVWERIADKVQARPASWLDVVQENLAGLIEGFKPAWGYGSFVGAMLVVLVVVLPLVVQQQHQAATADREYLLQLVYADDKNAGDGDVSDSGFVVDHLL